MRTNLIIFGVLLLGQVASAQITVSVYPKEISCEVGFTEELRSPQATSTCNGEVRVSITETVASGGCAGTMIRTYTYSDDCGNIASAEQYVKLKDTEEPQLIGVIPEILVAQGQPVPAPNDVRSWDNTQKEYPVNMEEVKTANGFIRRWTCSDDCGNTVVASTTVIMSK